MDAMTVDASFWLGKRVFLTGHTGFKGSWMSLWLQRMGAQLTGYSLAPPTQPNLFDVADVQRDMHSNIADVRDLQSLEKAMAQASPEIVIHMAAQPLVRYSYQNPVETYSTNVMGVVNLLEAVRRVGSVKAVVNVTSDKCYENREWAWGYRENDPMGGYDPYSNSKGCAELVTAAYRSSYFSPGSQSRQVAVGSARAGNVIGGGDWASDRLIPDMLRAIENGEPLLVRSPGAIRPWQHVLEPVSGYLLLAQKLYTHGQDYAEGWNFGPDDADAKPVSWIAARLVQEWGERAAWELDRQQHPHEATYLKLDCSKTRARLGWQPRWKVEQAIARVVEWHKACNSQHDMRRFTMNQIDLYEEA